MMTEKQHIVFLHGTGARGRIWNRQTQLPGISNNFIFCTVDLPGHGGSAPLRLGETFSSRLLGLLGNLGIRRPILVGHSFGALLSYTLAGFLEAPKVLLISPPVKIIRPLFELLRDEIDLIPTIRGTLIHKLLPPRMSTLVNSNPEMMLLMLDTLIRYSGKWPSLMFEQQNIPIHICVGRLDPIAPSFYVQEFANRVPNSTLHILEWAGHTCMADRPKAFDKWFAEAILS